MHATGNNNMHNEAQSALGIGLITSLLTFFSSMTLEKWAALIGIIGTLVTVALAVMRFLEERQLRNLDIAIKQRQLGTRGKHG